MVGPHCRLHASVPLLAGPQRHRAQQYRRSMATQMRHHHGWAEAPIKIARMALTIELGGNWNSFQLASSAPPLSAAGSATAPSARMLHFRRLGLCRPGLCQEVVPAKCRCCSLRLMRRHDVMYTSICNIGFLLRIADLDRARCGSKSRPGPDPDNAGGRAGPKLPRLQ